MPLTLEGIGYRYPLAAEHERPALSGASLHVEVGELVLLLGTTGSGKSTLLRVASGLLAPGCGEARIDGVVVDARVARGRVGLVFQDAEAQLFAGSVLEDVAFGPRNLGMSLDEATSAAREALHQTGLDPDSFAQRSPFSLSGGEARRAAIAGVLAMQPEYLLADEPTAGLDARGRRLIRALLRDQRERRGVVVVSHAIEEFLGIADKVVVLADGAVAWSGPAADLVADPSALDAAALAAPDVLEVQRRCAEAGLTAAEGFTLDPGEAARRLACARGVSP